MLVPSLADIGEVSMVPRTAHVVAEMNWREAARVK